MRLEATPPSAVTDGSDLRVTGSIRVILTVNLGKRSFRGDPDKSGSSFERYHQLRGTRELAAALRTLRPSPELFARDAELDRLQREAYEAGVFTQYVLDHEFLPRYRLVTPEGEPPAGAEALAMRLDASARSLIRAADDETAGNEPEHRLGTGDRLIRRLEEEGSRRLVGEWRRWPVKKVGWSRYGLLQIFLERPLERVSLLEALRLTTSHERQIGLESLLQAVSSRQDLTDADVQEAAEHRTRDFAAVLCRQMVAGHRTLERLTQIEIAAHVAELFLGALDWRIPFRRGGERPIEFKESFRDSLHWDRQEEQRRGESRGLLYPLRFRYVVFDLPHLEEVGSAGPLAADGDALLPTLRHEHKRAFAQLLAGAPVRELCPDDDRAEAQDVLSMPWSRPELLERALLRDTASWPNELCLFTGNDAVICYAHPDPPNCELHLAKALSYRDYWQTVVRCVEYCCELRTMAKLMEHETSDALEEASDYLFQLQAGPWTRESRELRDRIDDLRSSEALASRLIARLRNVSMPTTVARTDYLRQKVEALNETLSFQVIIRHVEQNLQLIDQLLAHDESMLLQRRSTKLGLYLALAALFVSLVALPASLDTLFTGGLRGFLERTFAVQPDLLAIVGLIAAPLVFVVVLLVTLWFARR